MEGLQRHAPFSTGGLTMMLNKTMTLATVISIGTIIGMAYAGWNAALAEADNRYVMREQFKEFEHKLFVRDLNNLIDSVNRELDVYNAKLDTGVELKTWEKRLYEKAKLRKLVYEKELSEYLKPKH